MTVSSLSHVSSCRANSRPLDDRFNLPYLLDVRPSGEFVYESAKNKLLNLKIGCEDGPQITYVTPGDVLPTEGYEADGDGFAGRQGQLLRLSGWIDVESRLTVNPIYTHLFCTRQ